MTSPGWIIDRTPPAAHTIAALPRSSDPIQDLSFSVSDRDLDNDGFQDASLLQAGDAATLDVAIYARLLGDTGWTGPLTPTGVTVPGLLTDAPAQTISGIAATDVDFGNLVGSGEHATVEYAIRVSDRAGNAPADPDDVEAFGTVEIDRKAPSFSSANPPRNSAVSAGSRIANITMDESLAYAASVDPLVTAIVQLWQDGTLVTSYRSIDIGLSGSTLSVPVSLAANSTYELRTTTGTLEDLYDNGHTGTVVARWYTAPSGEPTITGTLAADVTDTGRVLPTTVLGADPAGAASTDILFTLATAPAMGSITLAGLPVPAGGSWTLADIEDGRLGFSKAATEGGITVQFLVRLSRIGTPTTIVDSAWITLSLEAVNAPPSLALNTSSTAYDDVTDGLTPVPLFPSATTTDSEGFASGSLSISLVPNDSGDRLSIATDATILLNGSAVDYDADGAGGSTAVSIAVRNQGGLGQALTFSLQSNANSMSMTALLQRIRYHHAMPSRLSTQTKVVTVSITDAGGDTTTRSMDLVITAQNDAPIAPRLAVNGLTSFILPNGLTVLEPLTATDPEGSGTLRFRVDPNAAFTAASAEVIGDDMLRFSSIGGVGTESFTVYVTDRPTSIPWSTILADPSAYGSAVFTAEIGGDDGNVLIPYGDSPLSLPATGTAIYGIPVLATGSVDPTGFTLAFSGEIPSGLNISSSTGSISLLWNAASGPAPATDTIYTGGIIGYRRPSGNLRDVFYIPLTMVLPGLPSGGG